MPGTRVEPTIFCNSATPTSCFPPPWPDDSTSAVRHCFHFHLRLFPNDTWIGLPTDARSDDVAKLFEGYGRIVDCRVMTGLLAPALTFSKLNQDATGFGFVEFENGKVAPSGRLTL